MKKKYEKIIWNMYENMHQIPLAINGSDARSSFVSSYISAYKDMESAWNYICIILDGLKNIEVCEDIIKNNVECDKREIRGQINHYGDIVKKASDNFDDFIQERKSKNWN